MTVSFIIDSAMCRYRPIPRSTERISSLYYDSYTFVRGVGMASMDVSKLPFLNNVAAGQILLILGSVNKSRTSDNKKLSYPTYRPLGI